MANDIKPFVCVLFIIPMANVIKPLFNFSIPMANVIKPILFCYYPMAHAIQPKFCFIVPRILR